MNQSGTWIVAITQINRERQAAVHLGFQGFESYLPRFRHSQLDNGGKWKSTERVLFPRYIFVKVYSAWRAIRSTTGVADVLLDGERPAKVPDKEIEFLRARQDPEGLIVLPKAPDRLQPGMAVRVNDGPLMGFAGICEGMQTEQRVRVLLNLLGGKTRVELPERSVSAAL